MIDIDLSNCRSRDDICRTARAALEGRTLVHGRLEARHMFRKDGLKGRIRENIVFHDKREISQISPLHRDILVVTMVRRFTVAGSADKEAYALDIVTY